MATANVRADSARLYDNPRPDFHRSATARTVMRRAWDLARQGRRIFGGSVRKFFAEALRQAWAATKADPVAKVAAQMIAEARARRAAGVQLYGTESRRQRNRYAVMFGR